MSQNLSSAAVVIDALKIKKAFNKWGNRHRRHGRSKVALLIPCMSLHLLLFFEI